MKSCCYALVLAPIIDVPWELAVRHAAIRIDSINQFVFNERLSAIVLPRHSLILSHVICDNDLWNACSFRFIDVRPKCNLSITVMVSGNLNLFGWWWNINYPMWILAPLWLSVDDICTFICICWYSPRQSFRPGKEIFVVVLASWCDTISDHTLPLIILHSLSCSQKCCTFFVKRSFVDWSSISSRRKREVNTVWSTYFLAHLFDCLFSTTRTSVSLSVFSKSSVCVPLSLAVLCLCSSNSWALLTSVLFLMSLAFCSLICK